MNIFKRTGLFFIGILFFACGSNPAPAPVESREVEELDAVIREASDYLNRQLPAGNKLVILNIQSEFPALSEYIIDELIANTVNDRIFSVVDRQQLNTIRAELDFQMSGEVDDETAQALGRMAGAQIIVSGAISRIGNMYRLRVRALKVQSAEIEGQFNRNISDGPTVQALVHRARATGYGGVDSSVAPSGTATAPKPGDDINGDGWIIFNGHRYVRFDTSMTWTEAKAYCENLGGHLVTITSSEEQNIAYTLVKNGPKKQYWLGADRAGNWVTGERWTYDNWARGQPDGLGNGRYIQMYRQPNHHAGGGHDSGQWNDVSVDNTYRGEEDFFLLEYIGFICEFDN
jgi:hypothetical protein